MSAPDRAALIEELSALAVRINETGGPGELAAHAAALVEVAAAALPPDMLPWFAATLLERVESGARIGERLVEALPQSEGVH